MKSIKVLSALGLLAVAGSANAAVTSTWTLTNDYDFRGITQSAKDPALQASLDYAHDSGFYAGVWFSNVKFAETGYKGDLERDLYLGITNKINDDLTYDVGVIAYTYNQHLYDWSEIYGALTTGPVKFKLAYTPDYGGDFISSHKNVAAWALMADATIPLPSNFSLLAHAGYNFGDAFKSYSSGGVAGDPYVDYSVGVGYTAGKFNLALKYIDTTTTVGKGNRVTSDVFNNEGRVAFTVGTTFPW